jgi:hypothetical protein
VLVNKPGQILGQAAMSADSKDAVSYKEIITTLLFVPNIVGKSVF